MQNLLRFLITYYHFLIFLALEFLALTALVKFNNYHQSIFFTTSNAVSGTIYQWQDDLTSYINLREENTNLLIENQTLRQRDSLINTLSSSNDSTIVEDSASRLVYSYRTARVINNSIFKRRNFFTINKGKNQGISKNMGVITPKGIAGKIINTGDNYALAMSVLHEDFVITPKINGRVIYGGMGWEGDRADELKINKVNAHYEIEKGDSVFTTSHSHFFPENIMIGTVKRVQQTDANYQELWIGLSNKIGQLGGVYVVKHHYIEELIELENSEDDE